MTLSTGHIGHDVGSRLLEHLGYLVRTGGTRGAQVVVRAGGGAPLTLSVGTVAQAHRPLTDDTRFCVYSISKTVVATAVHLLAEDGRLRLDDPVVRHLPGFGAGGRGRAAEVTIADLMTHRAGVPDADESVPVHDYLDWPRAIDRICALPVTAEHGRFVYHKLTAYALLVEIVQRAGGRPFTAFADDRVFRPLGMHHTTWGLPDHLTGEATEIRGATATTDRKNHVWRLPEIRRSLQPSMGLYSTAGDIARLLTAWLRARADGGGPLGIGAAAARSATSRHAPIGRAPEFGYGLGFMVGRDPVEAASRGLHCSAATFGHPGRGTAVAYADPATGLVAVLLLNTDIGQPAADRRFQILADLINDHVNDHVNDQVNAHGDTDIRARTGHDTGDDVGEQKEGTHEHAHHPLLHGGPGGPIPPPAP